MNILKSPLVLALLFATLLTGCDSMGVTDSEEKAPVSLSLTVVGQDLASVGVPALASADGLALSKSGHIEITRARLLVRSIQFHARDMDDGDDDDGDDGDGDGDGDGSGDADSDDAEDFRTERMVLELNLDGTPTEAAIEQIPVGTYHRVSFRIHKPEGGEDLADTDFADFKDGDSGQERYSILIDWKYTGEEDVQTYASSKPFQQKVRLDPDFVVEESGVLNVALEVDVSQWFIGRNGDELDPGSDSQRVKSAIDRSIRDSFRAFPDNDRDGRRQDGDRRSDDNNRGGNGGGNGNGGNGGGNGNGNGNGGNVSSGS